MATPIVAGVVALMQAVTFDTITVDEIEQILKGSATKLSVNNLGAGVVNGGLAIQMAKHTLFKETKENLKTVATTAKSGNLKLKWDINSSYAEGYVVYRSTSKGGTYKKIKTITNPHASTFTDQGLKKEKFIIIK